LTLQALEERALWHRVITLNAFANQGFTAPRIREWCARRDERKRGGDVNGDGLPISLSVRR